MKRAVSISIGSSKRDKKVELELLGEKVVIERIGTDGDMERAAQMYRDLDGKVDAFGVGGANLGLMVDNHWYPLYSVASLVRYIKITPVVDGTGLKNTLEKRVTQILESQLGTFIQEKKAFITLGTDRWGMSKSLLDAGYDCIFGDLMFGLGIPIPVRGEKNIKRLASLLMPIAGRLPFHWVYPTGEKQEERKPKWEKYYQWGVVIAGDCHYITHHMPNQMEKKIIVTNTTTPSDVELFKKAGVKYLLTTTPVFEGRSFGTNMIEAALVAVSGKKRPLTWEELDVLLDQLKIEPQIQELNS
jgi:hypothetical protein